MSGVSMDFGKIDTMSNSANTWYGLWKTFQYAAFKKNISNSSAAFFSFMDHNIK